jgi:DNA-binding response OmpR family regulator
VTEVLLADDDDVGRYVIATMLRRAGFSVREVADGVAAVETARAHPPDIAILDVKMPGLDGFEACRKLKSNDDTRHIPVLMLSATFLETDAHVEGLETGADGYLTQPVEAPVLAATVRALLRARSAEAEVRRAASQWRTTFEAISDAVAVIDGAGLVERANRAFTAIFGEVIGVRVAALEAARANGELVIGDRVYSVRFDAVGDSAGEVITLNDVTAARQALAAERSISRTLQLTLLPSRLPVDQRVSLDAWHVAAERELIVGGDWYDVIETPRSELWLVMGDVAGHGVSATAQAGQLRHSLRVYAHEGYSPAESLRRLNELLAGDDQARMATMCIVAIGDEPSDACIACAGHPPPLVLPAGGGSALAVCDANVVLGVLGAAFVEQRLPFARGDRLVLYTDGLVERPGETIDDSLQRLVDASREVGGLAPLRAHLVDSLVGAGQPRDDVALLLAQRQ